MGDILYIGSDWRNPNDNGNVPYLWSYDRERRLYLLWLDRRWDAHFRFAAVRK